MNEEIVTQTHYRLIEALAREEQRHRQRMNHLQDAVFETDPCGVLVYLSHGWERMLGSAVEEALGLSIAEFVVPEDRPSWGRFCDSMHGPGTPRSVELHLGCATGGRLPVEITASRGTDGAWVGSIHDVSERNRQAESSRSRSRVLERLSAGGSLDDLLHALAQHMTVLIPGHPVSIFLVSEREGMLYRAVDIGLPDGFASAIRLIPIASNAGACGSAVFHKRCVVIEDTEEHPDWRPFLSLSRSAGLRACCSQPVFSSRGNVIATLAIYARRPEVPSADALNCLADMARLAGMVIEHKQTEMELLQHSEAVKQSPAAVLVTDTAGVIRYVNPRFVELTGYAEHEAIGRTPRILKSGLHTQEHYGELWDTLLRSEIWRGEFCNRRKDGGLFWQFISIAPIRDIRDQVTGYVSIGEDISRQKEAARQLELALLKEKEAGELKSRFLSMTSHEFRTPMSSIQLAMDLLREVGQCVPEFRREDLFGRVDAAVQRMKRMLDASLMISRANSGKMPFRPVPVDLVELVERILGECRQADDERHDIVFQCERRPVQAVVDPDICWNILTNLLRNACNYSIAGSQIVVSLKREPGAFALSVADRGIGIPEADQRRLFSSFERGSNVGSIKGTGLGLCIVKRLVEVHGGVVSFESRLDYGTSFTVMLPELPLGALPSPDHAIAAEDSHH